MLSCGIRQLQESCQFQSRCFSRCPAQPEPEWFPFPIFRGRNLKQSEVKCVPPFGYRVTDLGQTHKPASIIIWAGRLSRLPRDKGKWVCRLQINPHFPRSRMTHSPPLRGCLLPPVILVLTWVIWPVKGLYAWTLLACPCCFACEHCSFSAFC